MNRLSRWLLLLCVALLGAGCASLRTARRAAETDIVRSIRFEGNEGYLSGHNDYQLATQMEQGETAFGLHWPVIRRLVDGVPLDEAALVRDAYRLEVWYAHHGWFDARIQGWTVKEVRPDKMTWRERRLRRAASRGSERAATTLETQGDALRRRRKARVVVVVGHVDPGETSEVRSFEWTGLEHDPNAATLLRGTRKVAYLQEGAQFDQVYLDLTREQLLDKLGNHGFPYAGVEARVDAWPEERAVDARLHISRGSTADFGEVGISGNSRVPEHLIREALGFEAGDGYKISTLREAQKRLFALGAFSVVAVRPDLSDPSLDAVPVDVKVVETRFGTARAGGGLTVNATTIVPRLSLTLAHVNLFSRLVHAEVGASGGLYLSNTGGSGRFPAYTVYAEATHPRVFTPRLELSGRVQLEQDLQAGQLPYRNPEARSTLALRVSRATTLKLGAGFEQFHYLQLTGLARLQARAVFGRGFENPYQLITVEGRVSYDSRDDPLYATRGTLFEAHARQAVKGLFSDYAYTDVGADWRRLFDLQRLGRLAGRVVAVRVHGRALSAWGGSRLPYPELAFLGGATSLRGFRPNGVGDYDCLCTYESADQGAFSGEPGAGVEVDRRYLPQGGSVMAGGSLEVRHPLFTGASVVLPFVDVGALVDSPSELAGVISSTDNPLRWGAGVGLRYDTLVGPVRFDLAARPLYPEDLAPAEYTGCYRDDRVPRVVDWIDSMGRLGTSLSQTASRIWTGKPAENHYVAREHPPVVLVGYLAIGQAF